MLLKLGLAYLEVREGRWQEAYRALTREPSRLEKALDRAWEDAKATAELINLTLPDPESHGEATMDLRSHPRPALE